MLSLIKKGITAPKIVSADNFDIAIPSNLFEENVKISRATIKPCNVPTAANNKTSIGNNAVSLKTGNKITVIIKAATAGIPNLANK